MPTIIHTAAPQTPGKVILLGAGPGAVDLLTVRGSRLLAQADVVLYDALICSEMLELCPQALKVSVGKRAGQRSTAQTEINQQIVSYAQQYSLVVRLKGGDPMLFGRADEELRALEEAGIRYDIVPGITTALAAAAATRQPLTKRGIARSVALFTSTNGQGEPEQHSLPACDTLVQYMGGREAIATAQRLLAQGHPAELPVIAVENCSRANQRIFRMSLAELSQGLPETTGPVLVMAGWAMQERG